MYKLNEKKEIKKKQQKTIENLPFSIYNNIKNEKNNKKKQHATNRNKKETTKNKKKQEQK